MNIDQLKNIIPDYAKDIRLNLTTILTETGSPDLSQKQLFMIALGVTFALKNHVIVKTILTEASTLLSENDIQAAKSAATIMAMNNIYYRFTHLVSDKSFSTMPAKLRMNVIGNPGIAKVDFELMCLAISAINGCGMCMDAHTNELIKAGITKLGIQSAIRIASVLNAVSTSLDMQPMLSSA
jgi:alkyl hydroperoxide reductase subunit D